MIVEIAICTWNRAELLQQVLQKLESLEVPANCELRVIVVDNNSADTTAKVISRFQSRLNLVACNEKQQGHSFARNRAVEAATGDLMIWIDDDVIVGDDWLTAYIRAATSQPDISFWGGPIIPRFLAGKPRWIEQNWEKVSGCFAYRDFDATGEQKIELNCERLPYGANFAIRTAVQKQFLYDTTVGRSGKGVVGEEELRVLRSVVAAGHLGAWVPTASVERQIEPDRATTDYVQRYFVGQGRVLSENGTGWSTDPEELDREAKHQLFWYRAKRWFTQSEVWVSHLIRGSLAQGQCLAIQESTADADENHS